MSSSPFNDQRNLMLAMMCAAALIVGFQIFVEGPKRAQREAWEAQQQRKEKQIALEEKRTRPAEAPPETREQRLSASPRVAINSDRLRGSFSLKGLRFDDLTLKRYLAHLDLEAEKYRNSRQPNDTWVHASPDNKVVLLSPAGDVSAYFMQFGWLPAYGSTLRLPDENTVWKADAKALEPGVPVNLSWDNGQGVKFQATLSLDANYMFTITQKVVNQSGQSVALTPFAYINRAYADVGAHNYILHEGPLGVLERGALKEISYSDLREEKKQSFAQGQPGWLGFTDKYWLTALVPGGNAFEGNFQYYQSKNIDRYQAEFTTAPQQIENGQGQENTFRFFAGAKELPALDSYTKGENPVPLFDRAVDFGALYFLTKPIFMVLNWLYAFVGNFGIAIMLLTVIVKLLMFPLANKSYRSANEMRRLQPHMEKLKKDHGQDRMRLQKEMLELYKREKINPAAGCLPILIQIPVFFALYKVLFVTIEMRHAPFFGWIHDLSSADPSNIFNAFGLIPWMPPSFLHIGVLPILMCVSMAIQMRLQPQPSDPAQAKVLKLMPYLFLVMFATMPAGLVLYWTWSNCLSILQQWLLLKRYPKAAHGTV